MPYPSDPATSIAEVIANMGTIDESLPDGDGVKWFNLLYLRVTQSVDGAVNAAQFHDPEWISSLDIVFANLYFGAVRASIEAPATIPNAWQPLFDSRSSRRIHPIQFALAGMNAHINRDLPVALVQTAQESREYSTRDSARFQDFQTVNGLLKTVEQQIKAQLLADLPPTPAVADVIAMWSVEKACPFR